MAIRRAAFFSALCPERRAQPRLPADVSSWGSESLESRCSTASGAAAAAGQPPLTSPDLPRPPPPAPHCWPLRSFGGPSRAPLGVRTEEGLYLRFIHSAGGFRVKITRQEESQKISFVGAEHLNKKPIKVTVCFCLKVLDSLLTSQAFTFFRILIHF